LTTQGRPQACLFSFRPAFDDVGKYPYFFAAIFLPGGQVKLAERDDPSLARRLGHADADDLFLRVDPEVSSGARPPFALERLEQVHDDQIIYRLPRPQHDGATQLRLASLEFIDRLAALIPSPRIHRVESQRKIVLLDARI